MYPCVSQSVTPLGNVILYKYKKMKRENELTDFRVLHKRPSQSPSRSLLSNSQVTQYEYTLQKSQVKGKGR